MLTKYESKNKKLINTKGGVVLDAVLEILRESDRLGNNPYFPSSAFIQASLDDYGYITLMVFVCPKMRSKYLFTSESEKFMPIEEPKDGLFFPRVPKLQELVTKLWSVGVPTKILLIIGDNDFQTYKGPPLGVYLDEIKIDERRSLYLENLKSQVSKVFPQLLEVVSLGLMKVSAYTDELLIPEELLNKEADFQKWTLEKYYTGFNPTSDTLCKMAELKIRAYAEQGFLIESAGAILVNTEGTGLESWTQRTQMFQIAGAKFPNIYPYIRKEEIK